MAQYTRNLTPVQNSSSNLPAVKSVDLSSVIISSFESVKDAMELRNVTNTGKSVIKGNKSGLLSEIIPKKEREKFLDDLLKENEKQNTKESKKSDEQRIKEEKRKKIEAEQREKSYEAMIRNAEKGLIDFAQNPLKGAAKALDAGLAKIGGKTLSLLNTPIKDIKKSAEATIKTKEKNKGGIVDEATKSARISALNQKQGNEKLAKIQQSSSQTATVGAMIGKVVGKIALVTLGIAALLVGIPVIVDKITGLMLDWKSTPGLFWAKIKAWGNVLLHNAGVGIKRIISQIPILKWSPLEEGESRQQRILGQYQENANLMYGKAESDYELQMSGITQGIERAKAEGNDEEVARLEAQKIEWEKQYQDSIKSITDANLKLSKSAADTQLAKIQKELDAYKKDEAKGKEHEWGHGFSSLEDVNAAKEIYEAMQKGELYTVDEKGKLQYSDVWKKKADELNKKLNEGVGATWGETEAKEMIGETMKANLIDKYSKEGYSNDELERATSNLKEYGVNARALVNEARKANPTNKNLLQERDATGLEKLHDRAHQVTEALVGVKDAIKEGFTGVNHTRGGQEITVTTSTKDVKATAISA